MQLATKSLTRNRVGWIGVDIGSSAVKVAQVARGRLGWNLVASAVVPRQQLWLTAEEEAGSESRSSLNELQVARSLQEGFRGRKVAAALPMSLCDVHRLDRDLERDPHAMGVLRQTIETATQQSVENVQCDFWSAPQSENKPAWTQALTVSRTWTDQLCDDVLQAGWSCEAIDGLPLAIARAVRMVQCEPSEAPLAALDWGSGRATICFVEGGRPSYVRCLKDCGLRDLIDALMESLQVTDLEAQRLLEDYGRCTKLADEAGDVARLVQEIITEPLSRIADEIQRSISHFQYVTRAPAPKLLYLLGGGAMIRDLEKDLTTRLQLETKNWRLPTQSTNHEPRDDRADCLFASAIALSALSWEES
ncbi:MAG: pilus assembly protein PilM [Bythopirellula sp.]